MRVTKGYKYIVATEDMLEAPEECGKPTAEVAVLVRDAMPRDGQEHLVVVAMNTKGHPLAVSRVASGTVDSCPIYPRDVFAFALTVPLVRFVGIAHNHPSGVVTPSPQDSTVSMIVAKAGALLPIDLLWSIVVTHESDEWAIVPMPKQRQPKQGDDEEQKPQDEDEGEPEPDDTGDEQDSDDEGEGDEQSDEQPTTSTDAESEGHSTAHGDTGDEVTIDALKASVRAAFKIGGK